MNYDIDNWYTVLNKLADKYESMASSSDDDDELKTFILKFKSELKIHSLTKLNRWLGYIQDRLIAAELTTVKDERNFTRPYFKFYLQEV